MTTSLFGVTANDVTTVTTVLDSLNECGSDGPLPPGTTRHESRPTDRLAVRIALNNQTRTCLHQAKRQMAPRSPTQRMVARRRQQVALDLTVELYPAPLPKTI